MKIDDLGVLFSPDNEAECTETGDGLDDEQTNDNAGGDSIRGVWDDEQGNDNAGGDFIRGVWDDEQTNDNAGGDSIRGVWDEIDEDLRGVLDEILNPPMDE